MQTITKRISHWHGLPVLTFLLTSLLLGCRQEDGAKPINTESWQDINEAQFDFETDLTPKVASVDDPAKEEQIKRLADRLANSYAKLASQKAEVCPKLLQKQVDSAVIVRSQDVMIDNHCDYFIFPIEGQSLQVISSDNRIKRLLVSPEMYDFDNGAYRVKQTDKHVIRLQYDSTQSKPDNLSYDVQVIIQ